MTFYNAACSDQRPWQDQRVSRGVVDTTINYQDRQDHRKRHVQARASNDQGDSRGCLVQAAIGDKDKCSVYSRFVFFHVDCVWNKEYKNRYWTDNNNIELYEYLFIH